MPRRSQRRLHRRNAGLRSLSPPPHRRLLIPQRACVAAPSCARRVETPYAGGQATSTSGTQISGRPNDKQRGSSQVPVLQRAHLSNALDDEGNGQRIAGGEDRSAPFRKLIEVTLDQDGTETTETHNLCGCVDRTARCRANTSDVVAHVGVFKTVRSNERVDVKAACFRACSENHFDVTDCPGRDPWQDVADLVVGPRRALRSPQYCEDVRSRAPTLLMPDQSEINSSYTGNCATHTSVTSPGSPSLSSVFKY